MSAARSDSMPRETLSDRELAQLLDEQIAGMQTVLSSLEAERSALAARDGDALLQAVNDKANSLAGADALEQRRQRYLEQMGLSARGGSRQFSADAGVSQRWQQVLALTQQCRALNDSNGQLIRGQKRRTEGALRILRGDTAPEAAEYGPGGVERSRRQHRSLASY